MKKVWKVLIENSQDFFKSLQEILSHIQLVKSFGKETSSVRKYLRKLITNRRISIKNMRLEIISSVAASVVSKALIGLIAFYGGYQVIKGHMTLGSLTAIMVYLTQLIGLQGQFANFFQTTVLGLVSCQRVAEVLDEKEEISEPKDAKRVVFETPDVVFRDVSFGYRIEEYVLKDITFHIEKGSHVALCGPSGYGKTTILNLLLRLYDPWEGRIFINGYDIKDLKIGSLRKQIGIVLQEPFLWNDSIENNIRYGKEDATREEIITVSQLTLVDDFVKDLPDGYKTVIGEGACKLSEGQKQKIAIARALVKNPKILMLDEASSSMDSASEEKILRNIKKTQKDATLIVVSHRLSTVLSADTVYFLNSFNSLIIGKPEDLLKTNKEFSNLFAGQNEIDKISLGLEQVISRTKILPEE